LTIKQKEDEFFSNFPIPTEGFVRDGIVEEGSYSSSSLKLLFLLKEPNSPGEGGWSLLDHIHSDKHTPTFDTIARWVVGIRNLPNSIQWKFVKDISPYSRISALNYVVLFNLKKIPGYGIADERALEKYVERNAGLIKRQFSIYNPDIIICCGKSTARLFTNFISPITKPWQITKGDIPYREYESNKILFASSHPQARVNKERQYYGIVNAINEIFFKDK
jgi:hypothetical protein